MVCSRIHLLSPFFECKNNLGIHSQLVVSMGIQRRVEFTVHSASTPKLSSYIVLIVFFPVVPLDYVLHHGISAEYSLFIFLQVRLWPPVAIIEYCGRTLNNDPFLSVASHSPIKIRDDLLIGENKLQDQRGSLSVVWNRVANLVGPRWISLLTHIESNLISPSLNTAIGIQYVDGTTPQGDKGTEGRKDGRVALFGGEQSGQHNWEAHPSLAKQVRLGRTEGKGRKEQGQGQKMVMRGPTPGVHVVCKDPKAEQSCCSCLSK